MKRFTREHHLAFWLISLVWTGGVWLFGPMIRTNPANDITIAGIMQVWWAGLAIWMVGMFLYVITQPKES